MFSKELYQSNLRTDFFGREFNYQPHTKSTNIDAWKFVQNGATYGALVLADKQTEGKGRRHNKWTSTPNKSLTFSLILYPKIENLNMLPLLTGISIVRGIHSSTSIQTGLKWPNDIMLNNKKMGGILIESKQFQGRLSVVVGVGLNINEDIEDIPQALQDIANSVFIFSESKYSREEILSHILNEFETLYNEPLDTIIHLWNSYCIHKGKEVSFHSEKGEQRGIFKGISPSGHAKIQSNGQTRTYPSGIVVL